MIKSSLPVILIADDDAEDRLLAQEALEASDFKGKIYFVEDGEELMDYLLGNGKYSDRQVYPVPSLVLLDLNMPKKDGREALREIKALNEYHSLPVVVLTTSSNDEDIVRSYDLGVNSFLNKPVRFVDFVALMNSLCTYWFGFNKYPIAPQMR
ncbi:response regulator [Persicobacter psychrovividus]|uniref:Response regulator n=1 Tax=Persicobacter psychrovividus TaxID=387638 RepID=A0ABM7VED3_9BACT|nr:response regulator [Persicobacter psychrovividus]